MLNYGYKSTNFSYGNLVIGNDGSLGGICSHTNSNVIIPVPGSTIKEIPNSLINKYFPNGYTILKNPKSFDYCPYLGMVNSRLNSSIMCNPCNLSLETYRDQTLLSYGNLFHLNQVSNYYGFFIDIYGYFNQVNLGIAKGTMKSFFTVSSSKSEPFYIFDPESPPLINFMINEYNEFLLEGYIDIPYNGSMSNYHFKAILTSNAVL